MDMYHSCIPIVIWKMDRSTLSEVRRLKDANGRFLWMPDLVDGLNEYGSGRLFNVPISIVNEDCFQLETHFPDKESIIVKYEDFIKRE